MAVAKKKDMRFLFCTLLFLSGLLTGANAQNVDPLETLERQRFAAMINKDIAFLDKVLSDDLVYVHSNGLTETKADHISHLETGFLVYHSIQPDGIKVFHHGKTAVITGKITVNVTLQDRKIEVPLRYMDVYVKHKGKWQLAAWQSVKAE